MLSCSGAVLGLGAGDRRHARCSRGSMRCSIPLLRERARRRGGARLHARRSRSLTGIVFGLAPALQAPEPALHDALKDAQPRIDRRPRATWVRNALVVSEIAFACVLLVGAGPADAQLRPRARRGHGVPSRRSARRRCASIPTAAYTTREKRIAYFDEVLRRVQGDSGRRERGHHRRAAARDATARGARGAKGVTYERGKCPSAFVRVVSDGYPGGDGHSAARRARHLGAATRPTSEPVMRDQRDDGANAVAGPGSDRQDTSSTPAPRSAASSASSATCGISRSSRRPATRCTCRCASAATCRRPIWWSARRFRRRPAGGAVRAALAPIAPNLAGNDFRTLQQLVDKSVSPRRFMVLLLGGFAVFALILASLGIYALISYSVNQRTQEIGIRMALGASARDVQARIVVQTLRLAAIGMVIGAVASWLLARGASGLLFGVTAGDPLTFVGMLAVLTTVALSPAICRPGERRASIRWWRFAPSDRTVIPLPRPAELPSSRPRRGLSRSVRRPQTP